MRAFWEQAAGSQLGASHTGSASALVTAALGSLQQPPQPNRAQLSHQKALNALNTTVTWCATKNLVKSKIDRILARSLVAGP